MLLIRISKKLSEKLSKTKILITSRFCSSGKKILKWCLNNITVLMLFLVVFQISLVWYTNEKNKENDFENRKQIIYAENAYNVLILKDYMERIKNQELDKKVYFNKFSIGHYRENWKIIADLKPECANNLVCVITKMETINAINEYIIFVHSQRVLISEQNQLMNFNNEKEILYSGLEEYIKELNDCFEKLNNCKFNE